MVEKADFNPQNSPKLTEWNAICDHLNHWFYKPDTEALSIALAVFVAHLQLQNDPVWLFVVGPSGSGKTSIICNAINCLPSTMEVSDLTSAAFVSGLTKNKGGSSLLLQLEKIGKSPTETQGLLIFKDFSSLLSKKAETRGEIMAKMREIYDGSLYSKKGTSTVGWKGKVSVIAAVTPAIERAWAVQRDLGERFVQIRWTREDGIETAKSAMKQIDNPNIISNFQSMMKKFVDADTLPPKIAPPNVEDFVYLAEMAAVLRGGVIRSQGTQTIIDVPPFEAPTRLVKAMTQVAMGHARLFRKTKIDGEDVEIATRIAIDSVPYNRLKIINSIGEGAKTQGEIAFKTKLQYSSINYANEELKALGVIEEIKSDADHYRFTNWFEKLRKKALKTENVIKFKK